MDPEGFLEIANAVSKLQMMPFFFAAHCLCMCMEVKADLSTFSVGGAHAFSRKHPLALWVTSMLSIFGSQILVSLVLGEPPIAALSNDSSLLLASGCWYLIFYMPFDIGYTICKFLPIKMILGCMKEVMRCHKVYDGVSHSLKVFPSSYMVALICGTLKGNGTAFLKVVERLIRGVFTPNASEIMSMSFPTKASIVASIIFIIDKKTDLISAPHALVYFGCVIFFAYFKISSLLLGVHDVFLPFANLFGAIFFGGVWDTIERLLTPAKGDQSAVKADAAKNGKTDSAKKKE